MATDDVRRVRPCTGAPRSETFDEAGLLSAGRRASRSAAPSCRTASTSSGPGSTTTSSATPPCPSGRRRTCFLPTSSHRARTLRRASSRRPFKANLAFGKLSWQVAQSDVLDMSGFYRHENEVKDVGNQRAFESGTDIINSVWNAQAKNTWLLRRVPERDDDRVPGLQVEPEHARAEPGRPRTIQRRCASAPADNLQNFNQKRFSSATTSPARSARLAAITSSRSAPSSRPTTTTSRRTRSGIPVYRFRSDIPAGDPFAFPFEAQLGFGDSGPLDQQQPVRRLRPGRLDDQLLPHRQHRPALGLRDATCSTTTTSRRPSSTSSSPPYFGPEFFTDGNHRPAFTERVPAAPGSRLRPHGQGQDGRLRRLGALLRPRRVQRHPRRAVPAPVRGADVPLLGGRRSPATASRRSSGTRSTSTPAGLESDPRTRRGAQARGLPDQQQHRAALLGPVQRRHPPAVRAGGRVAVLRGRALPERLHLDLRQPQPGRQLLLAAVAGLRQRPALRRHEGGLVRRAPAVRSTSRTRASSRWAATLAYTYGHATANGGDFFTLDFIDVADSPRHRAQQDQRHTIVLSGIVGLPWDMMATTLLSSARAPASRSTTRPTASGSASSGRPLRRLHRRDARTRPSRSSQWDLAAAQGLPGRRPVTLGVQASVFNVTNHNNYGCFDGFIRARRRCRRIRTSARRTA